VVPLADRAWVRIESLLSPLSLIRYRPPSFSDGLLLKRFLRVVIACQSSVAVVQDPIDCFLEICRDAISIVSIRPEANEFLVPPACQDKDGAAARS